MNRIHVKRHTRTGNPWAICHASVGPKKSAKFERCVKDVEGKEGLDESGDETSWSPQDTYLEGQAYAPKGYVFEGVTDNQYDASLFKKKMPGNKTFRYTDDTWFLYKKS